MNETLAGLLATTAGLLLGAAFFGGLWWTIQRGAASTRPAAWFFGSFLLRMGIALGGLYLVGHAHWVRLLLCLLGFLVARVIVTRMTRPSRTVPHGEPGEVIHAP